MMVKTCRLKFMVCSTFRLFNIYQRPKCWNPEVFNPMAGLQQFCVCCGDFNFPVKDMHLGLLTGTGRHASSSQPIDAIWVSPKFSSCFDGVKLRVLGMIILSLGPFCLSLTLFRPDSRIIGPFGNFARIEMASIAVLLSLLTNCVFCSNAD